MNPQFSLIIPTFNARVKLETTLASIRAQSFVDVEIVVQDAHSGDGTRDFLQAQTDVMWQSTVDQGIYDAMNRAVARANGKWVLFLGAGDTLEPGVLAQLKEQLPREEGLHFVYGQVRLANGALYDGPFSASKLRTKNICQQAICYERTLFPHLGPFNTRYPLLADWEWNFRCFGDARVEKHYLPFVIARYEGGGASQERDEAFLADRLKLIRRHLGARQFALALAAKALPLSFKSRLKGRTA